MAIASNRRYDRISGDTNYTDPITKNSVNPKEAYYLKPDVSDTKIHHVYHKSTLQRILGSNRKAKSPITRRDFFQSNIREAPETDTSTRNWQVKSFNTCSSSGIR